jgi:sulfite exporter TauE/SafE
MNMNLWAIFLTGLTTGGLTCLAIQGGLLATALAKQVPVLDIPSQRKLPRSTHQPPLTGIRLPDNPLPVIYFLSAKLLAYTALGALLGALGSTLRLSPVVQAVLQIGVGIFMLGNALNMLNVHPLFRYFVIQPPRFLTRLVRNQAKSEEAFTPLLLGLMTVLIPCGTTQAMEVLAIGSGSAWQGALILFVFVLGTSPTFLVLGLMATQLRGKLQHVLAVATAVLVMALGIVSVDNGLKLMDSPLAPSRIMASLMEATQPDATGQAVPAIVVDGVQEITINVLNEGYTPNVFTVQSGQPIRLRLVTNQTYGCSRSFVIPSLGIQRILPDTGHTLIELPPQQAGQLRFTCSMGMYGGVINIY